MTNPDVFSGKDSEKKLLWIGIPAVFLIYLLYPTKNFYWDGIYFSSIIEDARRLDSSLFHPNHLFYNVIGYLGYQAAHFFGWQIRAVDVLQIVGNIFGAASAVMFFYILKRILRSVYLSFTLTLLFAFSATWWKFATDADAYIPSVFFLLTSFYLVLPNQPPRPLLTALAHSSAMFLHELAVLFFPVVVLGIFFQTASMEWKKRIYSILQYALAAFALTFGIFCASFYLTAGVFDLKNFVSWLTSYSPDIGFSPNLWNNLLLSVRGNFRLFVDGRLNFYEFDWLNIVLAILFGAAFVALIIKSARNAGDFKKLWTTFRKATFYRHPITILCAVWVSVYSIFLFFFIPGNTFYRLFYLPALILLFGVLINSSRDFRTEIRRWRMALLVVVVALANFLFFIRPYSAVRTETPLSLTLEARGLWTNQTIIYYTSLNSDNRLVRYFNPATVWKVLAATTAEDLEKERQIADRNGENIWLETTAFDSLAATPDTARWLAENSDGQAQLELNTPAYRLKFVKIVSRSTGN